MSPISGSRLVFIGGLHRSGTSLVHRILSAHPQFSGFSQTGVPQDEGQHLQTVYRPAGAFGGPGEFGFNQAAFMDEAHELATPQSAKRLIAEWKPHWDLEKPHLLEKSPINLVRTRFLQALFPGCAFVIILRHPVAVAYATKKWSRNSISRLVEHTLRCYERFAADAPRVERLYVLRYEELIADPPRLIGELVRWIGPEPHAMRTEVRDLNSHYFERWDRDRTTLRRRLLSRLGANDLRFLDLEPRANALGYSMQAVRDLLPTTLRAHDRRDSPADGRSLVPALEPSRPREEP